MVKISKHRRIMKFFEGKELPLEFYQEEMYQWTNGNKNAQVTRNELPQLLRLMGMSVAEKRGNQILKWKYIGDKNVMDREI
tara:strand:+ start:572 stop:814 length:243 start_codon:yes stop_codon:yes gene_type:complete